MKIALIADIHGNLPALEATLEHVDQWKPDTVLVAGDTVNRGPMSPLCLEIILERRETQGWHVIKGNHEDYVLFQTSDHIETDHLQAHKMREDFQSTRWVAQQLNHHIETIAQLPDEIHLSFQNNQTVDLFHGSARGNRDGIYPESSPDSLFKKIGDKPSSLFCVGHTHQPAIRKIDNTLIVNAGSVGLPFDRDQRACYAQITYSNNAWRADIIRLDYDYTKAFGLFKSAGFIEGGGPLTWLMIAELLEARGQLYVFSKHYQEKVFKGSMSIEDAAVAQLKYQNLWDKVKPYL